MKRFAILAVLLAAAGLTTGPAARAQDKVFHVDPKKGGKVVESSGTIQEESPTQILLKPTISAARAIPAADIVDIVYEALPKKAQTAYKRADVLEKKALGARSATDKKRNLEDSLKAFQDLLPDAKGSKAATRQLQYRIARLTARLADDDKTQMKPAVDLLAKFRANYPTSWQLTAVMDKLADLQRDLGDFKGAAKTYEDMSQMKVFTADKRQRYELEAAMSLLKGKDHKAAKDQLLRIRETLKPDDPQSFRLQMYIAQCDAALPGQLDKAITQLRKIVLESKEDDKFKKSIAHATLADCYLANNQLQDALFEYLKVDLLYGSDRGGDQQEHARVCTELARLFRNRAIGQPARAKEYEDKAESLRR